MLVFDDGSVDPALYYLLQLFVPQKYNGKTSPKNAISASMVLDSSYNGLEEATSWAVGKHSLNRIFIDKGSNDGSNANTVSTNKTRMYEQIQKYSSVIYSFMSTKYVDFMFVNYRPVREFYMYYTKPRLDHELDFCDNGYHYFEVVDEIPIDKLSRMLAVMLTVERPECPGIPTITAGEISYRYDEENVGYYRIKIMPEIDDDDIYSLQEHTDLPFDVLMDTCKILK